MRYVYMALTNDKYELPYAIADSPKELAEIIGTRANIISSVICHNKQRGAKRSQYAKVELEDEVIE